MKKLLFALALLCAPVAASAQCNGIFPNNTICGNISGAGNLPRPLSNSVLTGVPGGTNGQIQYNNSGNFGGFTLGGDCAIAVPAAGTIVCTKTNGVAFAPIATVATAPNLTYTATGTGGSAQTAAAKFAQFVNVADYTTIANAVTAACASTHVLYFGPGTFSLSANLTATCDLTIIGAGRNSNCTVGTTLSFTGAFGIAAGQWTIHASDFCITTTGAGVTLGAIGTSNFFSVIERVTFRIVAEGVHCYNCNSVWIQNNVVQAASTSAVILNADINPDAGDSWIKDNFFNDCANCIFHIAGGGWKVFGNKFVTGTYAYFLNATFGLATSSSLLIANNSMEGMTQDMIAIANADGLSALARVIISGNQGGAAVHGINVANNAGAAWINHLSVTNNMITNVNGDTTGITVDGAVSVAVNGNVVVNLGTGTLGIFITALTSVGFVTSNTIKSYTTKITNNGINVTAANNGP